MIIFKWSIILCHRVCTHSVHTHRSHSRRHQGKCVWRRVAEIRRQTISQRGGRETNLPHPSSDLHELHRYVLSHTHTFISAKFPDLMMIMINRTPDHFLQLFLTRLSSLLPPQRTICRSWFFPCVDPRDGTLSSGLETVSFACSAILTALLFKCYLQISLH